MKIQRFAILAAAISGGVSVSLGAFGAHALRASLAAAGRTGTFETAVKYQFYHTLALLIIGLLLAQNTSKWLVYSTKAMVAGIVIFSGSLYALCFTGIHILGAITPVGGVAFVVGWATLAIHAWQQRA